jgi:hypothetical protein
VAGGRFLPEGFTRWIPATATAFSASGGMDLRALYREILALIKTVPEGAGALEQWEGLQKEWKFNLEGDLLSWIEGTMISFSVPGGAPGMPGGDEAVILAVRDTQTAKTNVDRWIGLLLEALPPDANFLQVTDVAGMEGFRAIGTQFMPFLRPVFGFWKTDDSGGAGVLLVGSSENAAKLALSTRKGEGDDLTEHAAIGELGGLPEGPICSVSYQDLNIMFSELAQMCTMVTMFTAFLPENEEMKPVKQVLSLVPRLAPILQKMTFLEATMSVTTYDAESRTYRQHQIVRTKGPRKPASGTSADL